MNRIIAFLLLVLALVGPTANACDGYVCAGPGPVVALCPGGSVTLTAGGWLVQPPYTWSNGMVGDTIVVSTPGVYWVMASGACAPAQVTVVEVDPESLESTLTDTLCPGSSVYISAGFYNASFQWEDDSIQHPREFRTAGDHVLTCTFPCGTYQKSVRIVERDTSAIYQPTQYICGGEPVVLTCPGPQPYYLVWPDGSQYVSWEVDRPGIYWVTSRFPCTRNFFFPVEEDPVCFFPVEEDSLLRDCQPQLPNAFSPNADAINDVLMDYSHCQFRSYALTVFDRWGNPVFSSNQPQEGWSGTMREGHAPEGVYFWVLQYENLVRAGMVTGNVVLVR